MSIESIIMDYQKTRKEELFEDILVKFEPMIHSMCNKYKSHLFYEDILQDERLLLLECVLKFDISKGYKFSTYFYISCNGDVKYRWSKYSNTNPWSTSPTELPINISINHEGMKIEPRASEPNIDLMIDMERALKTLPPREQRIIQKYYYEGMKVVDIAAGEGCSDTNIFALLHKALTKLRQQYK